MQQRPWKDGQNRVLSIPFPLVLRNARGRRHLQIKSLPATKQSMLSKRREPQSVWRAVILIMSMCQSKARQGESSTSVLTPLLHTRYFEKGKVYRGEIGFKVVLVKKLHYHGMD